VILGQKNKMAQGKRNRMQPSKFSVGDRVRHSKVGAVTCVSDFASQETKDRIAKVAANEREGTVVETFIKTNARGARRHFANVQWDGSSVVSAHEQMRLLLLEKSAVSLSKIAGASVTAQKNKPSGITKKQEKREKERVEIKNLKFSVNKPIFTARTEEGFVGCVRTKYGICFTHDTTSTALEAANKARQLKALLETNVRPASKEKQTNRRKEQETSSVKLEKKVPLNLGLYTLEETKSMPLLRFKEVWVVTKGDMFVSDCFNKKTRKLVSYTARRDKAKIFYCHEEAKRSMRVLKGTVGPGFNLQRFFVENE
jgi:hypothetical protein